MNRIFVIALVGLSVGILTGCGCSKGKGGLKTVSDPPFVGEVPKGHPSCGLPLEATLEKVSPHDKNPSVNEVVTWEVLARGCTGQFIIERNSVSSPFPGLARFQVVYQKGGARKEEVTVNSVDSNGNIISQLKLSTPVTVEGDSGSARSDLPDLSFWLDPVIDSSPAVCKGVRRNWVVILPGQPVPFSVEYTGNITQAMINGEVIHPLQQVMVVPDSSNRYIVHAAVAGPNGTSPCPDFVYEPPKCTIAVDSVAWDSVLLKLIFSPETVRIAIDEKEIPMPNTSQNFVTLKKQSSEIQDGPNTARGVVASSTGDLGHCRVDYQRPLANSVAVGLRSTCAIKDGNLKCWGSNYYGQLGNGEGSSIVRVTPQTVTSLSTGDVTAVAGGAYHHCAIQNGKLKCWGYNDYGQLGNGSTTTARTPVDVTNMDTGSVTAVAAGRNHTCAIKNGRAFCWGANGQGQLGIGTTTNSNNPKPVSGLDTGVTAIAVGENHSCAIQNRKLYCWGDGGYGQLGNNGTNDSTGIQPVTNMTQVEMVVAAQFHTCALQNGSASCWGRNNSGVLGDTSIAEDRIVTTPWTVLNSGITGISASNDHSCAIQNQTLKCWGNNSNGQLGNSQASSTPVRTPTAIQNFENVQMLGTGGALNTCAVGNGKLHCWGDNAYGQIGDGTKYDRHYPEPVDSF